MMAVVVKRAFNALIDCDSKPQLTQCRYRQPEEDFVIANCG